MKKIISIFIGSVIIALTLVGCKNTYSFENKGVVSIIVQKINESHVSEINQSDINTFIEELNSLGYEGYMGDVKAVSDVYIIINFQDGYQRIDAYRIMKYDANGNHVSTLRYKCNESSYNQLVSTYL